MTNENDLLRGLATPCLQGGASSQADSMKLMDLQEVASILHVSPHTVRSWTRTGRLRPLRICRRLLFQPAEVQRLIASAAPPVLP